MSAGSAVRIAETTRVDVRSARPQVESTHVGHLVVVDEDGPVVRLGDPDRITFVRSAVKPLQAAACLELLAEAPPPAEVAVGWASHRGEPVHLDAVTTLARRSGTEPDELTCPPARSEADPGGPLERRRHNCSGKHALFALAGAAIGCPREHLLDPQGPLQRHVLGRLEDRLGPLAAVAIDGCGAPAVAVPLHALARAFLDLGSAVGDDVVRRAGHAHPLLVAGTGGVDTALLGAGVTSKQGAEGVHAASWTAAGRSFALALKIEDGAHRAAAVAVVALLAGAGVVGASVWEAPPVLGGGVPQGQVRASQAIADAAAALR